MLNAVPLTRANNASRAPARRTRRIDPAFLLILPTLLLYLGLLVLPLGVVFIESLHPYVGGRIGGQAGWTLVNYTDFMHVQYAHYFQQTLLLSTIASALGIIFGYPLARQIARTGSRLKRRFWINLLIAVLFLDPLVRCYALLLFFGSTGVVAPALNSLFGITSNNIVLLEVQVVAGLLYFALPVSALTLIGPIENISPKLCEAAQTLGASYWKSAVIIDFAISLPAVAATSLLIFSYAITSFMVPLILGNGFVAFVANVIYERFSETADFPSGSALSVLMLLFTLLLVYALTRSIQARWGKS